MGARLASVACAAVLSACVAFAPKTEPEWTSYPRDRKTLVHNRMVVTPPLGASIGIGLAGSDGAPIISSDHGYTSAPSIDFTTTEIGDTAEKELWIQPGWSGGSQEALLARIPEAGKIACEGDFKLHSTYYYLGGEATITMMGIAGPVMKATFRCPVAISGAVDPREEKVRQVASRYPDHVYFDAVGLTLPVPLEAGSSALQRTISAQRFSVVDEYRDGLTVCFIAEKSRSRLVACSEPQDAVTSVSIILFVYDVGRHLVAQSAGPERTFGIVPTSRKFTYEHSKAFVAALNKSLGG